MAPTLFIFVRTPHHLLAHKENHVGRHFHYQACVRGQRREPARRDYVGYSRPGSGRYFWKRLRLATGFPINSFFLLLFVRSYFMYLFVLVLMGH